MLENCVSNSRHLGIHSFSLSTTATCTRTPPIESNSMEFRADEYFILCDHITGRFSIGTEAEKRQQHEREEERGREKEREKDRGASIVEITADRGSRRMNFGMNAPRKYLDRAVASVSLLPKLTAERRVKMVAGRYSRVSKNDALSRQRITTGRVSLSRFSFPSSSFSSLSQHPLFFFFPFSASTAYTPGCQPPCHFPGNITTTC